MSRRRHQPKPGDLIEIKRSVYQHWALYLGDGYVIHVASTNEWIPLQLAEIVTIFTRKTKVKKQLLKEGVGNNDWEVHKYDRSHTPFPVEEIIKRAESYINREVTYDLPDKNCEHFVTSLRYGEADCSQVKRAIRQIIWLGGEMVASAVVGGVVAAVAVPVFGPAGVAAGVVVARVSGASAGVPLAIKIVKALFSKAFRKKRKSN